MRILMYVCNFEYKKYVKEITCGYREFTYKY